MHKPSKSRLLKRALALLFALILLAFAACNIPPNHVPWLTFASYDEVIGEFGSGTSLVFPKLDGLVADDASAAYSVTYTGVNHNEPSYYSVDVLRTISGIEVSIRFLAIENNWFSSYFYGAPESVEYRGEKLLGKTRLSGDGDYYCDDRWLIMDENEYLLTASYPLDEAAFVSENEEVKLRNELRETLLDFLRSVVDAAKGE